MKPQPFGQGIKIRGNRGDSMTTAEKSLPKSESSSRIKLARNCFLHDSDAHNDQKLQRILLKHGAFGYGVVWYLVEKMRRESSFCIFREDTDVFAYALRCTAKEIEEVINTALEVNLFFLASTDPDLISAKALIRDMEAFEIKKEKAKERMKKIRARSQTFAERARTQEEDIDTEEDKEEEPRTKKPKPGGQPKTPHGEHKHVWLSNSEVERYKLKFGEDFLNRAIEKLDSWIASDPIPKRIRNGKNASACFGSWVFNAIAEEQQKSLSTSHSGKSPPGKNSVSESYKRIFEEIAK